MYWRGDLDDYPFDDETPGGSPVYLPTPRSRRARPEKWEKGVWVTREGKKLKISEMEEGHLRNALRMLKRKGFIGRKTALTYLGPGPSGEMAQLAFAEEADMMLTRPIHPAIDDLEAELDRRGLIEGRP